MKRTIIKNPAGTGCVVKQIINEQTIQLTAQIFKTKDAAQAWINKQELMELTISE